MDSKKSPLADPKWGLAWSNRNAPVQALVRNALLRGRFLAILEAAHAHTIDYVRAEWLEMQRDPDSDVAKSVNRSKRHIDRMLKNIAIGFDASVSAPDVTSAAEIDPRLQRLCFVCAKSSVGCEREWTELRALIDRQQCHGIDIARVFEASENPRMVDDIIIRMSLRNDEVFARTVGAIEVLVARARRAKEK